MQKLKKFSLDVEEIESYYGETKILDQISLHLKESEFLGIVGPNGSGKTTLLRTIGRVLKPQRGNVYICGEDVYTLSQRQVAQWVGAVPQDTAVDFSFAVSEVVMMGRTPHLGRWQGESKRDLEICHKVMDLTNILPLADRSVTELSGGERQRVIIAQALAQEPQLLLLDEPTAHLDISYQLEILELIRRLKSKGLAVVAVFQDLNLAATYSDYLLLLSQGKVESLGPPKEVLTEENIRKVFGVEAAVSTNPFTGALHVSPLVREKAPSHPASPVVHLLCGMGTGAPLMQHLLRAGFSVTAGVINALDTDESVAESLGLQHVSEAPFSPIAEEAHLKNLELAKEADVVVVTEVVFGPGNVRNLQAAGEALKCGIPVLLMEKTPVDKRDYTNGEASRLFEELKGKGAEVIKDERDLWEVIMERKKK